MSSGAVNSGGSFWDNPEIKASDFATFKDDGDFVEGIVAGLEVHTFPANDKGPERKVPKLILASEGGQTEVTCGPADLRKKIEKARPELGDWCRIEQVAHNETALGTQRFFTVQVKRRPADPEPETTGGKIDPWAGAQVHTGPWKPKTATGEVPF